MKKNILFLLLIFCFVGFNVVNVFADERGLDPYENNGFTDEEIQRRIEASGGGSDENIPEMPEDTNCPIFVVYNSETREYQLSELYYTLQDIFNLIKFAAPALVIALSLIDYLGAIAKSNDDEVKKATKRTVKRVIVGLLIFFLPFLLDILFEIFHLTDISRCGIGT